MSAVHRFFVSVLALGLALFAYAQNAEARRMGEEGCFFCHSGCASIEYGLAQCQEHCQGGQVDEDKCEEVESVCPEEFDDEEDTWLNQCVNPE